MKKKEKKILIVVAVIVILAVLVFLSFSRTQQSVFIGGVAGPDNVYVSLVNQDDYSYNYKYTVGVSDPSNYKFGSTTNSFNAGVVPYDDTFRRIGGLPTDINKNIKYKSTNVEYSVSASVSNSDPTPVTFNFIQKSAICTYNPYQLVCYGRQGCGTVPEGISCEFTATIDKDTNLFGLTNIELLFSIPKSNYECGSYTDCGVDKECQNGVCVGVVKLNTSNWPSTTTETLNQTITEIINDNHLTPDQSIECVDNLGCSNICGSAVPTCQTNKCFCDAQEVKVVQEDGVYSIVKKANSPSMIVVIISSLVIIMFLVALVYKFSKKKRR